MFLLCAPANPCENLHNTFCSSEGLVRRASVELGVALDASTSPMALSYLRARRDFYEWYSTVTTVEVVEVWPVSQRLMIAVMLG